MDGDKQGFRPFICHQCEAEIMWIHAFSIVVELCPNGRFWVELLGLCRGKIWVTPSGYTWFYALTTWVFSVFFPLNSNFTLLLYLLHCWVVTMSWQWPFVRLLQPVAFCSINPPQLWRVWKHVSVYCLPGISSPMVILGRRWYITRTRQMKMSLQDVNNGSQTSTHLFLLAARACCESQGFAVKWKSSQIYFYSSKTNC